MFPYSKASFEALRRQRNVYPLVAAARITAKTATVKLRLWHYVADVVLKGGKIPSVKRKGDFFSLIPVVHVSVSKPEYMFIHRRSCGEMMCLLG